MSAGHRVLVLGAGPIGLAAVFWARRLGAGRIAVAASSRRREGIAHDVGATSFHVMDDGMGEALLRELGGEPDLVIECIGIPGMIERAIELVRPRGTVVILGLCLGHDSLMPFTALTKELRLQFAQGASLSQFGIVADALSSGAVEPRSMITDTISLEALPTAFEALRQRTSQCKVMVDPWRSTRAG
ncbi:MAG: zinc-binding dehydrogenase [Steroidobacteraceae bacterium]